MRREREGVRIESERGVRKRVRRNKIRLRSRERERREREGVSLGSNLNSFKLK